MLKYLLQTLLVQKPPHPFFKRSPGNEVVEGSRGERVHGDVVEAADADLLAVPSQGDKIGRQVQRPPRGG